MKSGLTTRHAPRPTSRALTLISCHKYYQHGRRADSDLIATVATHNAESLNAGW